MSGHSKWATIKHKKAATDARRGKVFTKLIRELTIAARTGGTDPVTNPRLRTAILTAKGENMPNDNIERAIQRGAGNLEGETLDEVTFEGYGPGGVGLLVQVVTSNRNRIVSEIRHMLSKNGGNMAETGAVGWMFERKGDIVVPKEAADEEKMMGIVLDAGAEDLRDDGAAWEVTTPPEAMEKVREALILQLHSDQSLANFLHGFGWSSNFPCRAIVSQILSARVQHDAHHFFFVSSLFRHHDVALALKHPTHRARFRLLPPFFESMWRISLTMRFQLPVTTCTSRPTPPGP